MKHALITLAAIGLGVTASLSDTPVSETDATNIRATMQAWGCSGGKIEQESEGTGVFEVDDANARTGNTTSSATRNSRSSVLRGTEVLV